MVASKERFAKRRARLLGPNGCTLKAIELVTDCYVMVQGSTVSAMGSHTNLKIVRRIVLDCMRNIHPIYRIKELMIRRELAKDPELKNENWDRFLPKFKKKNVQRPKVTITHKPAQATPFPPAQQPRKEDLQMASGEYWLKKDASGADSAAQTAEAAEKAEREAAEKAERAAKRAEEKRLAKEALYTAPVEEKTQRDLAKELVASTAVMGAAAGALAGGAVGSLAAASVGADGKRRKGDKKVFQELREAEAASREKHEKRRAEKYGPRADADAEGDAAKSSKKSGVSRSAAADDDSAVAGPTSKRSRPAEAAPAVSAVSAKGKVDVDALKSKFAASTEAVAAGSAGKAKLNAKDYFA